MTAWKPLKPGDIVDIVAPASAKFTPDVLSLSQQFITELGLIPRVPADLFKRSDDLTEAGLDPFCANSDQYRFNHLKQALFANDSQAVWCIRGGYGSMRLIDELAKLAKPEQTKAFIGFSDVTALHLFLTQSWGWCTVHGPVLSQFCDDLVDLGNVDAMKRLLFSGDHLNYDLTPLNDWAKASGHITAPITGGNLCMVETSIGTKWQARTTENILFLEDVDERGYSVDRSLEHLRQANMFDGVKAVVFGDFVGGNEKNGTNLISHALLRCANYLKTPVFSVANIGHGPLNYPLLLGNSYILASGTKPSLSLIS